MKKTTFLILMVLLWGCSSRQPSTTLLELDEGIPVTAKEYDHELLITNPLDLAEVNGKLLLFMHSGESPVWMVNPEDGTLIGHWSRFGNGPDEFTAPIFWGQNNSNQELYLYDVNYRSFRTYHYQAAGDSLSFDKTKEFRLQGDIVVQNGTVLNNHNIVTSVIYMEDAPLLLLDAELNPQSTFGRLPGQPTSTEMRTYTGRLSSYEDMFAFGMDNLGYLAFYSQSDTVVQKEWEIYLEKPAYQGDRLDAYNLKQGFVDIEVTKHYVIGSYCGRVRSRGDDGFVGYNILVFNHKGKLLQNLKLDKCIGRIAVSEDEKTIYAVAYEPDVCIVRYSLDNL